MPVRVVPPAVDLVCGVDGAGVPTPRADGLRLGGDAGGAVTHREQQQQQRQQ